MRFISAKVHGILDHVLGLVLLLASIFFSFTGSPGTISLAMGMLGALILLLAVSTRNEIGLFKVTPMRQHLVLARFCWAFPASRR